MLTGGGDVHLHQKGIFVKSYFEFFLGGDEGNARVIPNSVWNFLKILLTRPSPNSIIEAIYFQKFCVFVPWK